MVTIGNDIATAAQFLRKGELVAIPTETVYGLAGNAFDARAVASIFSVKNRPSFDPLIVHVRNQEEAAVFVTEFPEEARRLTNAFWPGPLTLLLPRTNLIPDLVTAGLPRVAVRCPNHSLTLELLGQLDFPLAAPSANPFGYVSPVTALHVADQLGQQIPYILDGGPCAVGLESTIVGWENAKPIVYRLGGLAVEAIERIIGKVDVRVSSSRPEAPGQLISHYAPSRPVILGVPEQIIADHPGKRVAVMLRNNRKITGASHHFVLSADGDSSEGARNLFSMLREFDNSNDDILAAESWPDEGLGRAINDRLRRATGSQ